MYDRDAHAMICRAYSHRPAWLKAVSALCDPDGIVPSVLRSTMDFLAFKRLVEPHGQARGTFRYARGAES